MSIELKFKDLTSLKGEAAAIFSGREEKGRRYREVFTLKAIDDCLSRHAHEAYNPEAIWNLHGKAHLQIKTREFQNALGAKFQIVAEKIAKKETSIRRNSFLYICPHQDQETGEPVARFLNANKKQVCDLTIGQISEFLAGSKISEDGYYSDHELFKAHKDLLERSRRSPQMSSHIG